MNVAETPRTRSRTRIVVLVLWAGAVLVLIACPVMLSEPVMWAYLLDPDLLVLIVVVGIRYTGLEVSLRWLRVWSTMFRRLLR